MVFKELIENVALRTISFDEPMKKHTSFGVGGTADYYAEVDSLYALNALINLAKDCKISYKVLGAATNVLVSDEGYRGLIITTKRINDVFFKRDCVQAMAGATIEKLLRFNFEHRLSGLEALSGLPATVGGAIVMNAGAFGKDVSENVVEVHTLADGKIKKYYKSECKFGYRKSRFLKGKEIVVCAIFKFENSGRETISTRQKIYLDLRKEKQPVGRSCGSVFKNPQGQSAGEIIDKCGLKNLTIGGAKVSDRHANFIVTSTGCTAKDVFDLISLVKRTVHQKCGIMLKEEVEYIGEFNGTVI